MREREGEWIERAGGQALRSAIANHQAVAVREGQEDKQRGEEGGGCEQDPPRPIRPPRYTVNGPINMSPASKALPIHALASYRIREGPGNRHAEGDHPTGQRDDSRACNNAENPQQWLARNLRRHGGGGGARDIYRRTDEP